MLLVSPPHPRPHRRGADARRDARCSATAESAHGHAIAPVQLRLSELRRDRLGRSAPSPGDALFKLNLLPPLRRSAGRLPVRVLRVRADPARAPPRLPRWRRGSTSTRTCSITTSKRWSWPMDRQTPALLETKLPRDASRATGDVIVRVSVSQPHRPRGDAGSRLPDPLFEIDIALAEPGEEALRSPEDLIPFMQAFDLIARLDQALPPEHGAGPPLRRRACRRRIPSRDVPEPDDPCPRTDLPVRRPALAALRASLRSASGVGLPAQALGRRGWPSSRAARALFARARSPEGIRHAGCGEHTPRQGGARVVGDTSA